MSEKRRKPEEALALELRMDEADRATTAPFFGFLHFSTSSINIMVEEYHSRLGSQMGVSLP